MIKGKKLEHDYNNHFKNLSKINEQIGIGAAENYKSMGLRYGDAPQIVGITGACENVDTLFKVNNHSNLPLFFTQTGQLALEQALQSFHGMYTTIHSGRDEEEEDERHLRQFRLTEEEFDCTLVGMTRDTYNEEKMFNALLEHIQKTIQAMVRQAINVYGDLLKKEYKRDIQALKLTTESNFYRISYEKAIELLNKNGYPNLVFGEDLKAHHEAKIVSLLNKKKQEIPVFITHYPKEIKFFNMKVYTKDPRVVLSADLILPYAGEATGSAVREHDFEKLNNRLLTSKMYQLHTQRGGTYDDFKWYLDIIKSKATYPHAGYGIGNERVLQYIFAEYDIRKVSIFSLLSLQTHDWDLKKRGQSAFYFHKRNILLSIGKITDKEELLQSIQKLNPGHYFLYSTQKTHLFLEQHGIKSTLVYKISDSNKKPSIKDLLTQRIFDIVINIPKKPFRKDKEQTDGYLIRKMAVDSGVTLVTDVSVAKGLLEKISLNSEDKINQLGEVGMEKDTVENKYRHLMHEGISINPLNWSYDINKSYDWNYDFGPHFKGELPEREILPTKKFLSFSVNSLFGIPAGPLLNSRWIELYAKLGFDILTYKTVRTRSYSAHSMPHILYVEQNNNSKNKNEPVVGQPYLSKYDNLTITNSFGVPSKDPDVWQEDVKNSLKVLSNGQLLIVSVIGTQEAATNQKEFVEDFVKCAQLALEAGAPVIEVNLSCPNLHGGGGIVCYDAKLSGLICKQIKNAIGDVPLIAKIGYYEKEQELRDFVAQTGKFIDGIVAINTVKKNINDVQIKKTHFRNLLESGVCGTFIKPYGINMVERLRVIRNEWKMKFAIVGVGGVTIPEDYEDYINAGSDAVMSGSGAMMDPYLAHKLYEKEKIQMNDYQSVKSIGSTYFIHAASRLNLEDLKKMYLEMIFPKNLSESKQTLLVREKTFGLKNGEMGRKTSHIYLNHRNPIFVDGWDRKLLVKTIDTLIKEKILQNGTDLYGVIAIPSSSSPELTSLMLDMSNSKIDRSVVLPKYIHSSEKGAHQFLYGEIDSHKPWVMIDDVFTSGSTLKKAMKYLPKGDNVFAVSLVCRNPEVAEKFIKETDCRFQYLISLDDVLKYHWSRFTSGQKKLIKDERHVLS